MGRLLQGGLLYTPRGLQAQVQPPSHGQARQHSSWHFLLSLNPKSKNPSSNSFAIFLLTRHFLEVVFVPIVLYTVTGSGGAGLTPKP